MTHQHTESTIRRVARALAAALCFATALLLTVPLLAQEGPDEDPDVARGYVNNIFHHSSVDSINLYNGSLTIPIPLGPSYPVGPNLKFQAMLTYNSRVWEYGYPAPGNPPPQGSLWSPFVGDPALGIGWNFNLGAIKRCGKAQMKTCYIGPDGAEHQFSGSKTLDGSQFILKSNIPTNYEMWDGDGNHYIFGKHVVNYDDSTTNYTEHLGRGRDGYYLTSLSDPFGNTITVTHYPGQGTLPCWDSANMSCPNRTGADDSWIPHFIDGPSWRITVNLDGAKRIGSFQFPVTAGAFANWSLLYEPAPPALSQSPPNTSLSAARLKTIAMPSASYSFLYNNGSSGYTEGYGGLLKSMTLPTSGVISYVWTSYSYYHPRRTGLLNCSPKPPPPGSPVLISGRPDQSVISAPGPGVPPSLSGCHPDPWEGADPITYSDRVAGVARRTQTLGSQQSQTDYVQFAFPFGERRTSICSPPPIDLSQCGPQTVTLAIFPKGREGRAHATATVFWDDSGNTTGDIFPGDRTSADIETRTFDFDPYPYFFPSTPAVSQLQPFCTAANETITDGSQTTSFCPNHAVRVTQRTFDYDLPGTQRYNRRLLTETTYHQATNVLGQCSGCKQTAVAYDPTETAAPQHWENAGRHFDTETRTGNLTGATEQRTVTTTWTPQNWGAPPPTGTVLANLYSQRDIGDGSRTIKQFFEFDTTKGFLKGQLTWDLSGKVAYVTCRFPAGSTGNVDSDLSDAFGATTQPTNPTLYCLNNYSPTTPVGQNNVTFGRKYTYQNGQLSTAKWKDGTVPAGWAFKNYTRDLSPPGWVTDSYDTASVKTHYSFDALGRVTRIEPDGETATVIAYDDVSRWTTATRSGGIGLSTWLRYEYDELGRLVRERKTIPGATVKRFTKFDLAGHAYFHSEWLPDNASETLTENISTTCKYTNGNGAEANHAALRPDGALGTYTTCFDPFGRPQKIVGAKHSSVQTIYRTDGLAFHSDSLETITTYCVNGTWSGASCQGAALNPIASTRRDSFGRISSVTEPSGDVTNYAYDVNSRLRCVIQGGSGTLAACNSSAGGQFRNFAYDATGNLQSETTPEKGLVKYTSGGLGNITQETHQKTSVDPIDLTTTRTYDFAGRLKTIAAGGSTFVTNCYDGVAGCGAGTGGNFKLGKLTSRVGANPSGTPAATVTQSLTYSDPTGRLSSRSTSFSTGALATVTEKWSYNSLGLLAHDWHPRDSAGSPFVVSTVYDQGLPITEYANGIPIVKVVTYLNSGVIGSYTTGLGTDHDVTTTIGQDASQLSRPSQIYTLGAATVSGSPADWSSGSYSYDSTGNIMSIGADTFTYDSRSRLVSASLALSPTSSQYFCYDRWGNRVSKATTPPTCSGSWINNRVPPGTTNYDARGNQTGNGTETYSYDNLDRQFRHVGSTTWNYLFDAASERVVRILSGAQWNYTLRDESNRLSTEYTGSTPPVFSRDQVFLGNLLVASYANLLVGGNTKAWRFYSSDHLGSPRLVTDIAGVALESPLRYWPYGDPVATPVDPQRLRFAGMERDTEANRYYDHARSQEFTLGRFLSPDPVRGSPINPQTWNRFAYVLDNPLKRVDPTGEADCGQQGWAECIALKASATFSLIREGVDTNTSGSLLGVAANAAVGTALDAAEGVTSAFSAGAATGEAFGRGGDATDKAIAISQDVGKLGTLTLLMVGAVDTPGAAPAPGGAVAASTPVGRLGSPINVRPGTNQPGIVAGRAYTGHAFDRMQGRGLVPSVVDDTIGRGTKTMGRDGATIYTTEQARVIVNPNESVKSAMPYSKN